LSETLGASQLATAFVPDVDKTILAGQLVKTGFSVSVSQAFIRFIFILKEQLAVLFLVSVAV
jgi:hypothetical protein